MRKLRVLVPMADDLIPPDSIEGMSEEQVAPFKTEWDVVSTLRGLGHEVRPVGAKFDLSKLAEAVAEFQPHVCFNLDEDFDGNRTHDQAIVAYLEMLKQAYTGCNPRGLVLARDKALSKKILSYHSVPLPQFEVFPIGRAVRKPDGLDFPLIVKSTIEDGSGSISQASVVTNEAQLTERVEWVHTYLGHDAIAEQYIEGRELYVGVIGNRRLQTFPAWELVLDNLPEDAPKIATARVKHNLAYQKKYGIVSRAAEDLPAGVEAQLAEVSKEAYRTLELTGYARMDFRLSKDGQLYLLEANPNPQIARGEDFADSAAAAGYSYEQLLTKIMSLGMSYQPLGLVAA
jgi:D-alanine-D-alanine ligase